MSEIHTLHRKMPGSFLEAYRTMLYFIMLKYYSSTSEIIIFTNKIVGSTSSSFQLTGQKQ